MTCMAVFRESTAVATTQLERVIQPGVIQYQDADSWQSERAGERMPRMSWLVLAGNDGRRQLQILWSQRSRADLVLTMVNLMCYACVNTGPGKPARDTAEMRL